MAKLDNVKVSVGDRIRIVNAVPDSYEEYGYRDGEEYEIKGFTGRTPDIWPDGTPDSAIFLIDDEYVIIETEGECSVPKSTAELLAVKRAEVAELEAKLRGEIEVGTIAVTLEAGYHEDIPAGTLVRVKETNSDSVKCSYLDDLDWDIFRYDQIEIATYESARVHLIAAVDRQLAEAFPERV